MPRATAPLCPPEMNLNPNAMGPSRKYLLELLSLSHSSLMGIVLPLEGELAAATPTDSDEYKVPADYDLVVWQISAYWRSSDLSTEPALNANITALDVAGLTEARLQNVLATLSLTDRKLDVFESKSVPMSALYRAPSFLSREAPLLVPSNTTLKATFTAQSVVAANIGNTANYGLLLTGALIPLAES